MVLHFNDGWSVRTDGDLRIVCGPDGLYVTGDGYLIPVDNRDEGNKVIVEMGGKPETDRLNNADHKTT